MTLDKRDFLSEPRFPNICQFSIEDHMLVKVFFSPNPLVLDISHTWHIMGLCYWAVILQKGTGVDTNSLTLRIVAIGDVRNMAE